MKIRNASLLSLLALVCTSAHAQSQPVVTVPTSAPAAIDATIAAEQAARIDAATQAELERHDFSLLTLYSGKSKKWDVGAGLVQDFGPILGGFNKKKTVKARTFEGQVYEVNYIGYLSGVIGFTSSGSEQVSTGFGMGLRNVFFNDRLSILVGGYVDFSGGNGRYRWLGGVTFKF